MDKIKATSYLNYILDKNIYIRLGGLFMKKVRSKLIIMMMLISLVIAFVITATTIFRSIETNEKLVSIQKERLIEDYDSKIKEEVEIAISMIDAINEKTKTGELTVDEAKKQSADLLRSLRFGKDGYFWADTIEGINVVLLGEDVEGKSRINDKDTKGNEFIKSIIENGKKEDGGYTDYWFPKSGEKEASLKRGYSKLYKPYNWVIGTGNYIDDIDEIAQSRSEVLIEDLKNGITINIILLIVSLFISVVLASIVSKQIVNPLIRIKDFALRLSSYDFSQPVNFKSKDEFGETAEALNKAQENVKSLVKVIIEDSENIGATSEELSATVEELFSKVVIIEESIEAISTTIQENGAVTEEISASMEEVMYPMMLKKELRMLKVVVKLQ